MIIAIPDDYHGVVSKLQCLAKLSRHEVRIFRDVAPPAERLLANLRDAEIIVPVRERTGYTREIIARLPQVVPTARVVSSKGCEARGDRLHFTPAGYRELGRRYAQALLALA